MTYFNLPGYTFDLASGQYVPQASGMQTKTSDGPPSPLGARGNQGYATTNTAASPRNGRAATPTGGMGDGMQTASGGGLQAPPPPSQPQTGGQQAFGSPMYADNPMAGKGMTPGQFEAQPVPGGQGSMYTPEAQSIMQGADPFGRGTLSANGGNFGGGKVG